MKAELAKTDDPIFCFMHHSPFAIDVKAMDAILMQDHKAFFGVVQPHLHRIRHLFFGHLHRAVSGNWRGISYSCMPRLNHQVALDLNAPAEQIAGTFEPHAYGVVLVDSDTVVVHLHDFLDATGRFPLSQVNKGANRHTV